MDLEIMRAAFYDELENIAAAKTASELTRSILGTGLGGAGASALTEKALTHSEKNHADKGHGKLTGGEKALAGAASLATVNPGIYLGAAKARAHGHSAAEGAIRGGFGGALGGGLGAAAGHALGEHLGGGGLATAGSILGAGLGGVGGYKALTHSMGKKAAAVSFAKAKGLGRVGQLLSGSRAKALEDRGKHLAHRYGNITDGPIHGSKNWAEHRAVAAERGRTGSKLWNAAVGHFDEAAREQNRVARTRLGAGAAGAGAVAAGIAAAHHGHKTHGKEKEAASLAEASGMGHVGQLLAKQAGWSPKALDLAGLGVLAAPSVDAAQAHARAALAGDYNKDGVGRREVLPHAAKPLSELGGLGLLAASVAKEH